MTVRCACGATRRELPADFAYEPHDHAPLIEWSGGKLGDRRVAFELSGGTPDLCPCCGERPVVFMTRSPADRAE